MATDGGVLVADTTNHRVVHWAPGAEASTVVAGGRGSLFFYNVNPPNLQTKQRNAENNVSESPSLL